MGGAVGQKKYKFFPQKFVIKKWLNSAGKTNVHILGGNILVLSKGLFFYWGLMCGAHADCPEESPFCYSGECASCEECHFCDDGKI